MKRFAALLFALVLVLSLGACSGEKAPAVPSSPADPAVPEMSSSPVEPTPAPEPASPAAPEGTGKTLRVAALKGPTAMGMVKLMKDARAGETANDYQFTLAGSPDEIVGSIIKGDFDLAAVPTNLAATLYNKTNGRVELADLEGKTIYATGKGSTPEYALNYILAQNGLEGKVSVEYKSEHGELAALLAQGQAEIALLPQPFVTTALSQNDQLRVALDLTAEWDKAARGQSQLTMGCVIAQRSFVEENAAAIAAFLAEYEASVAFVTDAGHLDEAASLVVEEGILPKEAVAKAALPQCGITFVAGEEMKKTASGFLQVLYDADPSAVGGTLPDDGLYYLG